MPTTLKALELPRPKTVVMKFDVDAPKRACAIANRPSTSWEACELDHREVLKSTIDAAHHPRPSTSTAIKTSVANDLPSLGRNAIGSAITRPAPLAMSWPREPLLKTTASVTGMQASENRRITKPLGRPSDRAQIKNTVPAMVDNASGLVSYR